MTSEVLLSQFSFDLITNSKRCYRLSSLIKDNAPANQFSGRFSNQECIHWITGVELGKFYYSSIVVIITLLHAINAAHQRELKNFALIKIPLIPAQNFHPLINI